MCSPLFLLNHKGNTLMKLKILGMPIFRYHNIVKNNYKGAKLVLFGTILLTAGIGHDEGYHHHFSFGLFNLELFFGLSMKSRILP